MKNIRRFLHAAAAVLTVAFATSCAGPKQVFHFQSGAATPKVAAHKLSPEPLYTASNSVILNNLPRPTIITTPESPTASMPVALTKKDLRKLVRKTLKNIKDTTNTRGQNRRLSVAVNKDRINQLEAQARDFTNSVKVQNDAHKLTVDMAKPLPEFSQTEYILLGVAALLALLILLSLPVLGPILGVVLALAIIALGVGLLTGYIDLDI
jgi:hypothetical protein